MPGFSLHALLPSLKQRVTAIHQHGDRLYVGLANGSIQVYSFGKDSEENGEETGLPKVKLLKTHSLFKRGVDQIGVLPLSNQLVVLSDSSVTLHNLPDLKPPSIPLIQSRSAHTFSITTYTQRLTKKRSQPTFSGGRPVTGEVKVDESDVKRENRELLVVGCRKKVVVYGAGKGGLKEAWELNLPHSPRTIVFTSSSSTSTDTPLPETIHLLYSPQSSSILHLHPSSTQRLSVTDLTTSPYPPPVGSSSSSVSSSNAGQGGQEGGLTGSGGLSVGMGALSGLGGYVGLGGKTGSPVGTTIAGGEVLVARDELGVFYSSTGDFTRTESLPWASPPEAISFSNPFIYSVVPLPSTSSTTTNPLPIPTLQIHLSPTLRHRENLPLPLPTAGSLTISSLFNLSFPASTPAEALRSTAKVVFASYPTDKALGVAEGSTIWVVRAQEVGEEVDELVREGRVGDAIGLVEALGDLDLAPTRRLPHLKTLQALQQFAQGKYQQAIEAFLVFNLNSALLISLYPSDSISGKLHTPRDKWMALFGAVEGAKLEPEEEGPKKDHEEGGGMKGLVGRFAGVGLVKKGSVDTLNKLAKEGKEGRKGDEGDEASLLSNENGEKVSPVGLGDDHIISRAALEALMYFLSDRRQKLTGAISSLPPTSPLPSESSLPPLSSLPAEELQKLPSTPMTELDPEQLLRTAQVIYTALIKVYLVARPVLVGSLCRIENWCDVQEVEGLLKEKKKFGDLIDLYQGKKMHAKALGMLHELAKEEDDRLDRYPPTIRYLQKLGPAELPLILESSRWIFVEDYKMSLQIFTADEPEVEALPRREVVQFLEKTNEEALVGYLEHIIDQLGEEDAEYHDRLVELYMERARKALKVEKRDGQPEAYTKLLGFLSTSTSYRAHRLIAKLSNEEMPEARALLLGRMGKHESALQIYVFQLHDYASAESYCSRVYASEPNPHGIFLLLLRIYLLRPPSFNQEPLLVPALELIAKHGVKLDAKEVLDLLPPLVSMEDVKSFLIRTLRDGQAKKNMERVVRGLVGARKEQVERGLMGMQVKRVRITDQRICPQCQKRIGGSAIAVHTPGGEVTHLHCKDMFGERLAKTRG